jgi:hypothetical protein
MTSRYRIVAIKSSLIDVHDYNVKKMCVNLFISNEMEKEFHFVVEFSLGFRLPMFEKYVEHY